MPWKVDENGVLQAAGNGNPVWVTETGEEKASDYPTTMKRLSEVNGESRERKKGFGRWSCNRPDLQRDYDRATGCLT